MICKKCGEENKEEAKFCKKCGNRLEAEKSNVESEERKDVDDKQTLSQEQTESKKEQTLKSQNTKNISNTKKKAISLRVVGGIISVVIIITVIFLISVKSGKTIDLDKYITITAEGYDGNGKAIVEIDWNTIADKYGKKLSIKQKGKDEYGIFSGIIDPINILEDCIDVNLDKSEQLHNGDTIKYVWDIDEKLSEYLDCKVKAKGGTYKVNELKEIDTFDAFADLQVKFEGISSDGVLEMEYSGTELTTSDFSVDCASGLSNGDKVVITISDYAVDTCAEKYGMIPAELSKEYTVEGLPSYVTKAADISKNSLDELKKKAEELYTNEIVDNWEEEESLDGITYVGNYFYRAKDTNYVLYQNELYLVYKIGVHAVYSQDGESYDQTQYIYWYLEYEDLKIDEDGNLQVDLESYDIPFDRVYIDSNIPNKYIGTKTWMHRGYETLDELQEAVMGTREDEFEKNINE